MKRYTRRSPIRLPGRPGQTEFRQGWEVVLAYEEEKPGPFLVDLSHRPKWDIQDADLDRKRPGGLDFPETPNQCLLKDGLLVSRLNRTQAAVWSLGRETSSPLETPAATDVTDGWVLLALVGGGIFNLMEKVTRLDLRSRIKKPPFLVQGPLLDIPAKMAVLKNGREGPIILLAVSRGYGQSLAEALLEAGREIGLIPGGELVFHRVLYF